MFRSANPLLLGLVLAGAACSSDASAPPGEGNGVWASVRRTAYGIPHIKADNLFGAGAGLGYAQAQDAMCILADQVVKVRGERSKYFGPGSGDANVESDLTYRGLALRARAEAAYAQQSRDMRDLLDGFVAGYNDYLARTPPEKWPSPCTGAAWVKPITTVDLVAYHINLCMLLGLVPFLPFVAQAQPPAAAPPAPSTPLQLPNLSDSDGANLGSNGWAIGRDRSAGGSGMLLANPHFPWEGELRFYESQLTVPGKIDVYGSGIVGVPAITIGFNRHVAWTHTVTAAGHVTAYRLTLAKDDPTAYIYDGQKRKLERSDVTIDVLGPDGDLHPVSRTFWRSHYGPMLSGPGLSWTNGVAYTVRDANESNVRFGEQWLRMGTSNTLAELAEVDRTAHGLPWVNTIATSDEGEARYIDASRVPLLSAEAVTAYRTAVQNEPDTKALAARGIVLLDGSTARDEWVGLGDPSLEGLVPPAQAPQLTRSDFVMNANDVATYTNPAALIRDFPLMYGNPNQPPSARTHMNLKLLTETANRFRSEDLLGAILSNRAWTAEQLRGPVVERCKAVSEVKVQGVAVDVRQACAALAAWDGRFDLEQRGAVVWRELLGLFPAADRVDKGALYAEPFDPSRAAETPAGLTPAPASGPDPLLEKLGQAVLALQKAGIAVDARLGDVQWAQKGDVKIPIHGGRGNLEGTANAVLYGFENSTLLPRTERATVISPGTSLTSAGYPINYGTSFFMAVEFDAAGPRASALLSYSESTDPGSPHFADQTRLFSEKRLRPVLFEEAAIAADPELVEMALTIPR